jgi:two-component system LytT family response regulator
VRWIGAAGNYAELHLTGATHLVRSTLAEIEAGLDPARWVRIHRGTLVRVDVVREIIPATHGDYDVRVDGGETLKLSRRFRARLLPRAGP